MGIFDKLKFLSESKKIDILETGIPSLDLITGLDGLPKGRIIELYGDDSAGKTAVSLKIASEVTKKKGYTLWIDSNYSFNLHYAVNSGIDLDHILIVNPESLESALFIIEYFVNQNIINLIIIDTLISLMTLKELNESFEYTNNYIQSQKISIFMHEISTYIKRTSTVLLIINNTRGMGKKDNTPGGRSVKLYSSLRIRINRLNYIIHNNNYIGIRSEFVIIKNNITGIRDNTFVNIYYDKNIITEEGLLDLSIEMGIIERKGSYFYHNNQNIGQGKQKTCQWISNNADLIKEQIRNGG